MLQIPEYKSAEKVFFFFEEITKIPRGSGNTAKIADYLVDFANRRSLEVIRDDADNVIIKKGATEGYKKRPTVILQGHTDIVAVKTQKSKVDLKKDGLQIYRDGDFIRATGTSLGGDDGVAVAYALAILDSDDIAHPAIEAVFTTDEEVGLTGAKALDGKNLSGKLLINIDSDEEGVFTVGCAGGLKTDVRLQLSRHKIGHSCADLSLSGFIGGHSGVEIDKGRINAIKVLGEILSQISHPCIASISGGSADNAIPGEAKCRFYSDDMNDADIEDKIKEVIAKYTDAEPGIKFEYKAKAAFAEAFSSEDSKKLISLICEMPNGVVAMSEDIKGLVETSLNMGIIKSDDDGVTIILSLRSSKSQSKNELKEKVFKIARKYDGVCGESGEYPAWEYRKQSHLRDVMCSVYKEKYGKDATVITTHAGLECGIFTEKIDDLDCVSIGPDNFDIHTTNEHLSISSTVRVWEFLKDVIKAI